jgi:hypothetical protein
MLGVNAMQGFEAQLVIYKSVHLVKILSMGMVTKRVVIALGVVYVIILLVHARASLDTSEIDVNILL